ncbi:MAG: hypothetical protein HKP09_03380 [Enterobacterales bacterium]|nr:hypothetical protein [Enterobacterales bacterium]
MSSAITAIVPVDHAIEFPDGWSGEVGLSIGGQTGNKEETEFSLNQILRHSSNNPGQPSLCNK